MAGGEPATPVFALLGHGNEESIPYEERRPVPEGVTVVLFTEPGQSLPVWQAELIWDGMRENPELFRDPVENKARIQELTGATLRIYQSGAPLPAMVYYPEGSVVSAFGPTRYFPTGLYPIPVPFPTMAGKSIQKSGALVRENIEKLYSGEYNQRFRDLFESELQQTGRVTLRKLKEFQFPIQDILQQPGVYYLLNCRFIKGLQDRVDTFLKNVLSRIVNGGYEYANEMKDDFRSAIQTILNNRTIIPEKKLDSIRIQIQLRSGIPNVNTIEGSYTNEELQHELRNSELDSNSREYFEFLQLKRNLLAEFEHEFGALQQRVRLTRTLSNAHQMERYGRGGRRKRRRTRKRHSLNRKRQTHGK